MSCPICQDLGTVCEYYPKCKRVDGHCCTQVPCPACKGGLNDREKAQYLIQRIWDKYDLDDVVKQMMVRRFVYGTPWDEINAWGEAEMKRRFDHDGEVPRSVDCEAVKKDST